MFDVFFKSVTYRPTLSKSRGGPVKKITLYDAGKMLVWDMVQIDPVGGRALTAKTNENLKFPIIRLNGYESRFRVHVHNRPLQNKLFFRIFS